jgi:hypothetical protein
MLLYLSPQILALAVKSVFPSTKLSGGGITPLYFYYDFVFDFEFTDQHLKLVDERLKEFVLRPPHMEKLEMIPSNAALMFAHHKEPQRAEKARQAESDTIEVFRALGTVDYVEAKPSKDFFNFAAISHLEKSGRLVAVYSKEKEELKLKLKKLKQAKSSSHMALGSEFFDIRQEGVYWHPKGETLRQKYIAAWRDRWGPFMISTPGDGPLEARFDRYLKGQKFQGCIAEIGSVAKKSEGEGLFGLSVVTTDLVRFLGSKEYIDKALEAIKEHICQPATDAYGYHHNLSRVSTKELGNGLFQLDVTFFLSLEAHIALDIEKKSDF